MLGVEIDTVTLEGAATRAAELIALGGSHQVVTLNPEYLFRARKEKDLLEIVRQAALVTADGIGIVWAARVNGTGIPGRVTGIDLMLAICHRAAQAGWRVFFLGGRPGVAEDAAARLKSEIPGLQVAGTFHGYFSTAEEPEVIGRIRVTQPEVLFVGIGAPKQERWIHKNLRVLGVPLAMGVGGSFDVLSGRVKRAPVWMRRLGLEWLARLIREPRRWRRMLVLPRFALLVLRTRLGFGKTCLITSRTRGPGGGKEDE
ncbi:MAG: WecB/TagA/CpsF family glycosyltransferase [Bacillota bacterium]